MKYLMSAAALILVFGLASCSEQVVSPDAMESVASLDAAQGKMGDVPFKVDMTWTVTPTFAPGFPFGLSTFENRCSVPSTWVLSYAAEGIASHMGSITGEGSHCAVVEFGSDGSIVGGSGSDVILTLVAANGDELEFDPSYGGGGVLANGAPWFSYDWQILSGTGRFETAEGDGSLFGVFLGFETPSVVSMEGTLNY